MTLPVTTEETPDLHKAQASTPLPATKLRDFNAQFVALPVAQ